MAAFLPTLQSALAPSSSSGIGKYVDSGRSVVQFDCLLSNCRYLLEHAATLLTDLPQSWTYKAHSDKPVP